MCKIICVVVVAIVVVFCQYSEGAFILPDGRVVSQLPSRVVINGNRYRSATLGKAGREKLGVKEYSEVRKFDRRFYKDGKAVVVAGQITHTVTFARGEPSFTIDKLKEIKRGEVEGQCSAVLSATDSAVVRAIETGKALDAAVSAERSAVRGWREGRLSAIAAAKDYDALVNVATTFTK